MNDGVKSVYSSNRTLVLDGETRSCLAVVRSLGRLRQNIGVISAESAALATKSRFCEKVFISPCPRTAPEEYLTYLLKIVTEWKPDLLLPVTDISTTLVISRFSELTKLTTIPLITPNTFDQVIDKYKLLSIASQLNITTPKTLLIPPHSLREEGDLRQLQNFPYPAALKPNRSQFRTETGFTKGKISYPTNDIEVISEISNPKNKDIPYLLQQKVQGKGIGVFALCIDGEAIAVFCHRRILEKPPSGGVSVLSESIPVEQAPVQEALRLLKHLSWQGVAMVEFKQTDSGENYLMEVNPRFWGSLQLAIDAGVDFPSILSRIYSKNEKIRLEEMERLKKSYAQYVCRIRLRWLLGTLDHFLINFKQQPAQSIYELFSKNSLHIFKKFSATRFEVCRLHDFRPFLFELKHYLKRNPARFRSSNIILTLI